MEYLIKTYTNEGETVLDFVMGSGTTALRVRTSTDLLLESKRMKILSDFKRKNRKYTIPNNPFEQE